MEKRKKTLEENLKLRALEIEGIKNKIIRLEYALKCKQASYDKLADL